jgi:hypothetical protein
MVSSIFSQIYEQRAAASLSKLFYKVNDKKYMENLATLAQKNAVEGALAGKIPIEQVEDVARMAFMKGYENTASSVQRSKLAKNLSLGYMALTQSSNVYSDALAGGYDRRTAGFTSLLAASGQYALMANNQMGTWFLDKTTGYTENESKAVIRKAVKDSYGKVKEAFDMFDVDQVAGKAKLATAVSGFKSKIKTLLTEPILESEFAENIIKRSIIEGVEEVTEQAAIDASKGIVDVMSALGLTPKKGSFGGFDVVFSKAGFENYLANFVGGAIGGPLFELQRSIIEPMVNREKISLSTEADLYDLISTGRTADILSEIDNMKGKL